ncbi:MAG: SDR family oxidoreductase [Spirochaetes bacterium]|nr:SDR family oxidoreductase [Spirochaetota bacterium]
MIAVTGAAGELGARIAERLSKRGTAQRLLVRNAVNAPELPYTETAVIKSYGDTASMTKALEGIKILFLVSARDRMGIIINSFENNIPVPEYDRVEEHKAAVNSAKAAGVERVVYLSFLNASENSTFLLSRDHFHTEEFIKSSGLNYTFLRPNLYMDKVSQHIAKSDIIRAPAGDGRISWVSRDDIADVAAEVLTTDGHEKKIYDVTGPEALTMQETADHLSAATGRKISYQAQTPEEVRKTRSSSRMEEFEARRRELTGSGLTDYEVEVWISHYYQIAAGETAEVSKTVQLLCGHPAETLAQYLKKHPVE